MCQSRLWVWTRPYAEHPDLGSTTELLVAEPRVFIFHSQPSPSKSLSSNKPPQYLFLHLPLWTSSYWSVSSYSKFSLPFSFRNVLQVDLLHKACPSSPGQWECTPPPEMPEPPQDRPQRHPPMRRVTEICFPRNLLLLHVSSLLCWTLVLCAVLSRVVPLLMGIPISASRQCPPSEVTGNLCKNAYAQTHSRPIKSENLVENNWV